MPLLFFISGRKTQSTRITDVACQCHGVTRKFTPGPGRRALSESGWPGVTVERKNPLQHHDDDSGGVHLLSSFQASGLDPGGNGPGVTESRSVAQSQAEVAQAQRLLSRLIYLSQSAHLSWRILCDRL
jgi:hypothetical protein